MKSLLLGLKNGDIYKVDPSDSMKQEIIASLDDEINSMEVDDETQKLFVVCKKNLLYQIDLTGKENIKSIFVELGEQRTSLVFGSSKLTRYCIFHQGKFG